MWNSLDSLAKCWQPNPVNRSRKLPFKFPYAVATKAREAWALVVACYIPECDEKEPVPPRQQERIIWQSFTRGGRPIGLRKGHKLHGLDQRSH